MHTPRIEPLTNNPWEVSNQLCYFSPLIDDPTGQTEEKHIRNQLSKF